MMPVDNSQQHRHTYIEEQEGKISPSIRMRAARNILDKGCRDMEQIGLWKSWHASLMSQRLDALAAIMPCRRPAAELPKQCMNTFESLTHARVFGLPGPVDLVDHQL